MVVDGDAGVDARVLRHQVTDLQQDVAGVSGEKEEEERIFRTTKFLLQDQIAHSRLHTHTLAHLMSMVRRPLLLTGFWSGPLRVMLGLGRPHTLQQSTTVSPNAHTTSDRGLRNSGATASTQIYDTRRWTTAVVQLERHSLNK